MTRTFDAAARTVALLAVWLLHGTLVLAGSDVPAPPGDATEVARTLEALDRQVEDAVQRGDAELLDSILGDDFRFFMATQKVARKKDVLENFARAGNFVSRTLTSVDADVHGSVAMTKGRVEVHHVSAKQYTVCYVRLYESRGGKWQLISQRTFREREGFTETCEPL